MNRVKRKTLERGWYMSRNLDLVPLDMDVIESRDSGVRLESKENINVEKIMSRAISERLVLSNELFMKVLLQIKAKHGLAVIENINKVYSYHKALSDEIFAHEKQYHNVHNIILLLGIYIKLKDFDVELESILNHEIKLIALHLDYDLSDEDTEAIMRSIRNYELMNVITV